MKQHKGLKNEPIVAYLFLLPALLGFILLTVLPIIGVFIIGFTDWTGLKNPSWVGTQNYTDIFTKDLFFAKSVVQTIYFAIGAVIGSILFSFFISLMLNKNIPARGLLRAIYYLPSIIPGMAAMILWSWLYEPSFGLLNYILGAIGIEKQMWIYGETTSVPSLIILTVWATGNLIVIFLAGLQNVPKAYLEAVEIDGGNWWHKFKNITVPMMTPIIFFNLLMNLITNFQVFVPSFVLTNGGPNDSTLFIVFLIIREGFSRNNFGYASALSFLFFLFIALLTALIFITSKKWVYYEGK